MQPLPMGTIVVAKKNSYVNEGRLGIIHDHTFTGKGKIDYEVLSEQGGRIFLFHNELRVVSPPIKLEVGMKVRFFQNFWFHEGTVKNFSETHDRVGIETAEGLSSIYKYRIAPIDFPPTLNPLARHILEKGE